MAMESTWKLVPVVFCLAFLLQGCALTNWFDDLTSGKDNPSDSSGKGSNSIDGSSPSSNGAVESQLSRVEEGDGLSLSCETWGGGPRLVVGVAPESVDGSELPTKKMLLDTGSSTLAFCDSSLKQTAAYSSTNYISCNQYNPGGQSTGYWGPFVDGSVNLAANVALQGSYSIMAQEEGMPCDDGFDGIFGIAFRQLQLAFPDQEAPNWTPGDGKLSCPSQPLGVLKSPLLQKLTSDPSSAKFGIHWSGQAGDGQGMLYLGDAATSNKHYAFAAPLGPAKLGEIGWYDITVEKVDVGGTEFTGIDCDPRTKGAQCILDTGTPSIVVPQQIHDQFKQLQLDGEDAHITFWLSGSSGEAVPVTFDAATLNRVGGISPGASSTGLILGLPLWSFYYTVISINDSGVTFVPTSKAPAAPQSQPAQTPDEPQAPSSQPAQTDPWEPQPFPGLSPWNPVPSPWRWRPYEPSSDVPPPWWMEETNSSAVPSAGNRRMREMPVFT